MTRWKIGTVSLFALLRVGLWELFLTSPFRGRWSRNKVSVGEPAEGSLPHLKTFHVNRLILFCALRKRRAKRRSNRVVLRYKRLPMYFSNPFNYTELYSRTKVLVLILNNFQQWMSRLAHRWRTLRTAIRNANCRIQWVIEILNAYCTFGLCLEVCLYQCPYNKLAFLFLCSQGSRWQMWGVSSIPGFGQRKHESL